MVQALFHRPPAVAMHPSLDSLYKAPQRVVLQVVATPTERQILTRKRDQGGHGGRHRKTVSHSWKKK